MKKILVTLFIIFAFVQSAFASNWYELGKKLYVDLDSCRTISYGSKTHFRFFTKELNPGNWDLKNGKKVWFMLIEWETDGKRSTIRQAVYYDIKGNHIESYNFNEDLDYPIPDSRGEESVKIFEILYNKGYFKN